MSNSGDWKNFVKTLQIGLYSAFLNVSIIRSFIKRQKSGNRVTTSDKEWQRVVQRVTTNDNEWQRMTTSGATSDKEWQRVIQRATTSDNK